MQRATRYERSVLSIAHENAVEEKSGILGKKLLGQLGRGSPNLPLNRQFGKLLIVIALLVYVIVIYTMI